MNRSRLGPDSVTRRQYDRLVRTVAEDLKRYSIAGCEQRAKRRARSWFTRGWKKSRWHAGDLALQALTDAPYVLGYGHAEVVDYLNGDDFGYEVIKDPTWKFICALVDRGEEPPTDI